MGAAASIELLYKDAFQWFRAYVDTETYISDFNSIDKDSDGSLSYAELILWIKAKAKVDPGYRVFASTPQVVSVAHKNASRKLVGGGDKILSLTEFRVLLVQLFATSVLWSHFTQADNWTDGDDVGNKQLNFEEFKLACNTLCHSHAKETLTDEQIREDFIALDTNNSDSIGFVEVCNHCYSYIDLAIKPLQENLNSSNDINPLMDIVKDLQSGEDYADDSRSSARHMSALADRLKHENNVAVKVITSTKAPSAPTTSQFSPTEPKIDETTNNE